LSDSGKIRLKPFFGESSSARTGGAFDHAPVLGPVPGTEDALVRIRRLVQCQVDGLVPNLGLIRCLAWCGLQAEIPPLIARIDWSTVWSALRDGRGELLQMRDLEAILIGSQTL
jgi:hypothetical protein